MKVLVVINSLANGGAERVVSILTREWAKDHQVLIALFDASRAAYDHGGEITDLDTPSLRNPVKKLHNVLLRSLRVARVLRLERPDRIVSFMESANCPTIVAAAVTGFLDRLSVSVRCNPATIPWLNRLLIPIVYRLADRVVAPSAGVRNALQRMGLPPRKLLVIPNPLARCTHATTSTRSESPPRYILGVGRLEREKGFDRLLTAFAELDRSDVHLVILGDGTERSTLRVISQELGVASHLHLPGMVSDVDAWYRRADCFVLTSHYEGSPNVVVEAMANGCPVVSFDCPYGPAEILEGGYSGILVPQDDIEALSDAMQQLVSNRALRERLSKVGRKRAETFSVETIAPRWLNEFGERSE